VPTVILEHAITGEDLSVERLGKLLDNFWKLQVPEIRFERHVFH
jgi:hypothetical protein